MLNTLIRERQTCGDLHQPRPGPAGRHRRRAGGLLRRRGRGERADAGIIAGATAPLHAGPPRRPAVGPAGAPPARDSRVAARARGRRSLRLRPAVLVRRGPLSRGAPGARCRSTPGRLVRCVRAAALGPLPSEAAAILEPARGATGRTGARDCRARVRVRARSQPRGRGGPRLAGGPGAGGGRTRRRERERQIDDRPGHHRSPGTTSRQDPVARGAADPPADAGRRRSIARSRSSSRTPTRRSIRATLWVN